MKHYTADVHLFPFHNPTDMVQAAHLWCADRLAKHRVQTLLLPAGHTPKALYAYWEAHRPPYLDDLCFSQIDEVMDSGEPPFFQRFFQQELPSYAARIHLPGELVLGDTLAILGLGKNGHVAFHEPNLPPDFAFGQVPLASETCRSLGIRPPAVGLTYGLATLLAAKSILLWVAGDGKEQAWRDFLVGDARCPASHLRNHPDLTVLYTATLPNG